MITREPLKVFIGSGAGHEKAERAIHNALKANSGPTEIYWMKAGGTDPFWNGWDGSWLPSQIKKESDDNYWALPWSLFKFAVPAINKFKGKVLYLDVTMLPVGDVHDLVRLAPSGTWTYNFAGRLQGSPIVIDCQSVLGTLWPTINDLKTGKRGYADCLQVLAGRTTALVPGVWRSADSFDDRETKLIQFVEPTQWPWQPYPHAVRYQPHPSRECVAYFKYYANRAMEGQDG